jgi:hypothetical protein
MKVVRLNSAEQQCLLITVLCNGLLFLGLSCSG